MGEVTHAARILPGMSCPNATTAHWLINMHTYIPAKRRRCTCVYVCLSVHSSAIEVLVYRNEEGHDAPCIGNLNADHVTHVQHFRDPSIPVGGEREDAKLIDSIYGEIPTSLPTTHGCVCTCVAEGRMLFALGTGLTCPWQLPAWSGARCGGATTARQIWAKPITAAIVFQQG